MGKKLRVAVIGTGCIANSAHLPALDNLRSKGLVDIVAVVDKRPASAQETAARFNVPKWYDDSQKMLDELSPDLVAVCTPNISHKALSIMALEAGAHVVCEKPMALTYKDAKEMFDKAAKLNKILMACQSRRWVWDMQFVKDVIDQGDLGTPYFADISFIRRYGIPQWGTFHIHEENGGGPFCDLGVHFLDSLLWMTGNPRVEAVSGMMFDHLAKQGQKLLLDIKESGAYLGRTFTPRPYDHNEFNVEEAAVGMVRLAGNFAVNFKFTWAINLPTQRVFILCGDKGGINTDGKILYKNIGKYQSEIKMNYIDNRPYSGIVFDGHWYLYEHMLDVLEGKADPLVKPEETLNIVSAIEAFYKSTAQNREVATTELEGYPR